jgi:hypothetical protein
MQVYFWGTPRSNPTKPTQFGRMAELDVPKGRL